MDIQFMSCLGKWKRSIDVNIMQCQLKTINEPHFPHWKAGLGATHTHPQRETPNQIATIRVVQIARLSHDN